MNQSRSLRRTLFYRFCYVYSVIVLLSLLLLLRTLKEKYKGSALLWTSGIDGFLPFLKIQIEDSAESSPSKGNESCTTLHFSVPEYNNSIFLDGFTEFNFCVCNVNLIGKSSKSSILADILYNFCEPIRSVAQKSIELGESKFLLSNSVPGFTSSTFKDKSEPLWVFPKYIGLGPPSSGSSALQEYIMSNRNYYKYCTRGYDRCVNTKKEVKFWNRGRNLERSKNGRKYCYAPDLSCYLLRTPSKMFRRESFYGEITVSLLWHLKSPQYIQQLSPEHTKLILVLRDPVSLVIAWLRKRGTPLEEFESIVEREIISWQNCLQEIENEIQCAYLLKMREETSFIVSALYFLFLQNWLSFLPLSRFIFVSASKLRCDTENTILSVFKTLNVSLNFDSEVLQHEVNVNMNEVGRFSRGYGGDERERHPSVNQMGIQMTNVKKSAFCKPNRNLEHLNNNSLKKHISNIKKTITELREKLRKPRE